MLAIIFVVSPAASLKSSFLMLRSLSVCARAVCKLMCIFLPAFLPRIGVCTHYIRILANSQIFHELFQLRHKVIQINVPLHRLSAHAVALAHFVQRQLAQVRAVARVPWCLMASYCCFKAAAFSLGKIVSRWRRLSSVIARTASSSVMLRTIQGIFLYPASSLARCRRWPAMIS